MLTASNLYHIITIINQTHRKGLILKHIFMLEVSNEKKKKKIIIRILGISPFG